MQAHGFSGEQLTDDNLVEGGQLLFFSNAGRVVASDESAPECGTVTPVFDGPNGELTALETTAEDEESGIATVKFTLLSNMGGYATGTGPTRRARSTSRRPARASSRSAARSRRSASPARSSSR